MDRSEINRALALETARLIHPKHIKAYTDGIFGRGPELSPTDEFAQFGYRHGWYTVGEFCFSQEEITGRAYDHTQGGWAYV